jgi:methylthioribose-1-phosphate isomerase
MKVSDRHYRTIWPAENGRSVEIIDQRWLPHEFRVATLSTTAEVATAIRDMWVRGAPLIGVTAAYGVAIACWKTRPTRGWIEPGRHCTKRARPRSTCAGRWTTCELCCARCRRATALPPPLPVPPRSPTKMSN